MEVEVVEIGELKEVPGGILSSCTPTNVEEAKKWAAAKGAGIVYIYRHKYPFEERLTCWIRLEEV